MYWGVTANSADVSNFSQSQRLLKKFQGNLSKTICWLNSHKPECIPFAYLIVLKIDNIVV